MSVLPGNSDSIGSSIKSADFFFLPFLPSSPCVISMQQKKKQEKKTNKISNNEFPYDFYIFYDRNAHALQFEKPNEKRKKRVNAAGITKKKN